MDGDKWQQLVHNEMWSALYMYWGKPWTNLCISVACESKRLLKSGHWNCRILDPYSYCPSREKMVRHDIICRASTCTIPSTEQLSDQNTRPPSIPKIAGGKSAVHISLCQVTPWSLITGHQPLDNIAERQLQPFADLHPRAPADAGEYQFYRRIENRSFF